MNEDQAVQHLAAAEVLLSEGNTGTHFVLAGQDHAPDFINIKWLYTRPTFMAAFARAIAERAASANPDIQVVVGPAMGGVALAEFVGLYLSEIFGREVRAVYAEKRPAEGGREEFYVGRGYDEILQGAMVLVVEDVTTRRQGGSASQVVSVVQAMGGQCVLVAVGWNRGGLTQDDIGVPVVSLITKRLPSLSAEACRTDGPCHRRVPINLKHGRGAKYVEEHGQPA